MGKLLEKLNILPSHTKDCFKVEKGVASALGKASGIPCNNRPASVRNNMEKNPAT